MMKNRVLCLLTTCFALVFIPAKEAFADFVCKGGGGPVTLTFSPPLPDTFVLTGTANGQRAPDQNGNTSVYTATMNMNGCIPGAYPFPASVFVALAGSAAGQDLYTTTGVKSGIAMKVPSAGITVAGEPLPRDASGCSTSVGQVTQDLYSTRVTVCRKGTAVPYAASLTYNTTITFPGVEFIVTDNTAPPSTLSYTAAVRTSSGFNSGFAFVVPHTFGIIDHSGRTNLLQPTALPSVGGLACTQAVSIKNVTLPDVYAAQLSTSGAVAGSTPFTVDLLSCGPNASYIANAQWSFAVGAATNQIANMAASPANNVEVQILDSNLTTIVNNANTTLGTISSAGVYTPLTHYARYVSKGVAGAGNVNAVANYILTYR